ncbi:hypothetical protein CU097_005114 [Rhizopus azygosporus]|uniref:NodB homology domain-containing protein n=2 Tax=Rhizopus TaxID=4842 RepID=A0A367J5L1_RHIAZ|nr:hypothetical protein CU097_005114 [Rhizopus azygosporus]
MKRSRIIATLTIIPFFAAHTLAQYKADQDIATLTFAMTKHFTVTIPEGGPQQTDLTSLAHEDYARNNDAYRTAFPYDPQDEYYDPIDEILYGEYDPIEDQNDFDPYDGYGNEDFYDVVDDPYDNYGNGNGNHKEPQGKSTSVDTKTKVPLTPKVGYSTIAPVTKSSAASPSASSSASSSASKSSSGQVISCKTDGQVALTYSEGPSDVTGKIAHQLSDVDARASFFVNATWLTLPQYATVTENLYKAGHLIGMAYRVKNDNPDALTDAELRNDIVKNAQTIQNIIGVAPKYVRLHYTKVKNARTEKMLANLGFVTVGYNLDSRDYVQGVESGSEFVKGIYTKAFEEFKGKYGSKGSFISIHYDGPLSNSVEAIGDVVSVIEQGGYTMVRLDGCLNDPMPYKKNADGREYTYDKFSYKQPNYHQGQRLVATEPLATVGGEESKQPVEFMENMSDMNKASFFSTLLAAALLITYFF